MGADHVCKGEGLLDRGSFMRALGVTLILMTAAAAQDRRRVDFTLPFEKALAKAKAEKKLLFLKPIYGGVDEIGAKDYCRGSW